HDFHLWCPTLIACRWRRGGRALRRQVLGRERCVRNEAVVHGLAPRNVEVAALHLALPVLANNVVARGFGGANQREDELVWTLGVVQRRDQRLDDGACAVEGAT